MEHTDPLLSFPCPTHDFILCPTPPGTSWKPVGYSTREADSQTGDFPISLLSSESTPPVSHLSSRPPAMSSSFCSHQDLSLPTFLLTHPVVPVLNSSRHSLETLQPSLPDKQSEKLSATADGSKYRAVRHYGERKRTSNTQT